MSSVTYGDWYTTGQQDCSNIIDLDDFASAGTPEERVERAWVEFEEDGIKDAFMDQHADEIRDEGLDPDRAYDEWKAGWKARAATILKGYAKNPIDLSTPVWAVDHGDGILVPSFTTFEEALDRAARDAVEDPQDCDIVYGSEMDGFKVVAVVQPTNHADVPREVKAMADVELALTVIERSLVPAQLIEVAESNEPIVMIEWGPMVKGVRSSSWTFVQVDDMQRNPRGPRGDFMFVLEKRGKGKPVIVTRISERDLGLATEQAILWLNSHHAGEHRRDDEEPGREELYEHPDDTSIHSGTKLTFRRGGHAVYVVRPARRMKVNPSSSWMDSYGPIADRELEDGEDYRVVLLDAESGVGQDGDTADSLSDAVSLADSMVRHHGKPAIVWAHVKGDTEPVTFYSVAPRDSTVWMQEHRPHRRYSAEIGEQRRRENAEIRRSLDHKMNPSSSIADKGSRLYRAVLASLGLPGGKKRGKKNPGAAKLCSCAEPTVSVERPQPCRVCKGVVLEDKLDSHASEAIDRYKTFHRYDPKDIGAFPSSFKIPEKMKDVGPAKWTTYRSGKVDPATLKLPKRPVNYIHEHDAGVRVYVPVDDKDFEGKTITVPREHRDVTALAKLGESLGFCVKVDDDEIEVENEKPLPELYCSADGKCLYIIENKRELVAMIWGGALGVFARGIDG